ncbi:MAG TPA: hypothetical protein VFR91_09140 [Dyella sp.]|nr:hypothetical protein [Dyella sp.]
MKMKRIALGLAASVTFGLIAGWLLSLAHITIDSLLQIVLVGFVAATIGAFIARRGFVLPALGLWLVQWLVVVYVLYWIAEPTGQASALAIVQRNMPGFFLSAAAVASGALLGQVFAGRAQRAALEI